MLILGGLGLMHARRTSPAAEILGSHPGHARTPATESSQQSTHPSNQMGADDHLVAASPGASTGPPG